MEQTGLQGPQGLASEWPLSMSGGRAALRGGLEETPLPMPPTCGLASTEPPWPQRVGEGCCLMARCQAPMPTGAASPGDSVTAMV